MKLDSYKGVQGSQYGRDICLRFCRANNLAPSMSWRGNVQDNAVAESFFSSLKKNGSENASIKPGFCPGPISSMTLTCSTTGLATQPPRRRQSGGLRTGLVVRTEFFYCRGVSPMRIARRFDDICVNQNRSYFQSHQKEV